MQYFIVIITICIVFPISMRLVIKKESFGKKIRNIVFGGGIFSISVFGFLQVMTLILSGEYQNYSLPTQQYWLYMILGAFFWIYFAIELYYSTCFKDLLKKKKMN